jgi:crotonobetainyl-CoA:carnitine CoA-transferase CaiB-like acyl-CoA transferase
MAVGALETKFWNEVCDVVGRPDLKPHHWAAGGDPAPAIAALQALFATRTQAQWVEAFAGHDCCVTPVKPFEETLDDPQHVARGMVVRSPHPTEGNVLQIAPPLKLSDFTFEIRRPAPASGEHTDEVLREIGLGDDAIARLREARVV